jgi:primase-polymerase (primpol)-like protein
VAAGGIPASLKAIPQWVLWRWEQRPDKTTGDLKWTKPPFQPNGKYASSTKRDTWGSFDEVLTAYNQDRFDGIGIVLTLKLGIVGVDLDHCRDRETGAIEPWAQAIVDKLDSYTEVTPSGTGLRVFLYGKLPLKGRKRGNVEMYNDGRFLTLTGHPLDR